MFDWDEDYENLVKAPSAQGTTTSAQGAEKFRFFAILALATLGALAAGFIGPGYFKALHSDPEMASADSVVGHVGLQDGLDLNLQALEPEQAMRFRDGLRRFSDAELLYYARDARRDHAGAMDFMRPYMADANALIGQELARRDL